MTPRELITKWGFEVKTEPLDRIEKQLEGIKHRLEFLASIEVLKGVFELTESFAKFAEEIEISATNAGITTEAFQRLAFAASKSGVSQEEMSASMARASRVLYEAKKGSEEAQKTFAALGFTPQSVQSLKNGGDVMYALGDKVSKIHDPIKRAALLMELTGRSGYKMAAFLSKGSGAMKEAGESAEVLSEGQVKALVDVEHAMSDLWNIVKTFGATIAAYLAPNVKDAIESFKEFYDANKAVITLNIKTWIEDFSYALGFMWGILKGVVGGVLNFVNAHQTLSKVILYTVAALGVFATGMLAAIQVGGFFISTFEKGKKVAEFGVDLWKTIAAVRGWSIWSKIGAAATWVWNTAMSALTAEVAFLEIPVWAVVAGIGALILAGQALWKVFVEGGSFEDTWLGSLLDMIPGFQSLIGVFKDLWGVIEPILMAPLGPILSIAQAAKSFLGSDEGTQENSGGSLISRGLTAVQNMTGLGGITQPPASMAAPATVQGDMNYSVNAPITISVPSGTNPKDVAQNVKDAIKEHLNQVHRETARSLRPAQAY